MSLWKRSALRDKVAIVAGASGGIGAPTARALVAEGMRVVLAAPDDPLLDALARELAIHGDRVLRVPTDITRRDDIARLVAATLAAYGKIDAIVNVAGIGSTPSFVDSDDAELKRVLAINLLGPARLIHAALPTMIAQRSGAIVNIGSVAGEAAIMGIYSGSKFGLRGLTDSLRRELRQYKIGVTLIEPGFVATSMNGSLRNLPPPEIVANAIVAAIRRPRRKHIVPAFYRPAVFLVKLLPGFVDLVVGHPRIQARLNRDARASRDESQAS